MNLTSHEINRLRSFIKKNSGISLDDDKEYLIKNRLSPVVKKLALDGFQSLCNLLDKNDEQACEEVIDAISTNETFFFRDLKPFSFIESEILPNITEQKLNILSAACSSGQEAYSIAMMLKENKFKHKFTDFNIEGYDISQRIVKKAQDGIYSQFEVQRGLPIQHLIKYFNKLDDHSWTIKKELKEKVKFEVKNLFEKFYGEFDIIFCRNVLIYFEPEEKKIVLSNLVQHMKKGSVIILGSSETNNLLPDQLKSSEILRSAYYKM